LSGIKEHERINVTYLLKLSGHMVLGARLKTVVYILTLIQPGAHNESHRFPSSRYAAGICSNSTYSEIQSLLADQILSRYLKWRLIYFMAIQNGLGRGKFFSKSRMCQY